MIIQRQGDNSYRIYFGITVPENYIGTEIDINNPPGTRDTLLGNFFHQWDDSLKEYIRQADNFRSWPLYQFPAESLDWQTVPGVTLAGDAAHLALPNGEGVNLAMLDALELVSCIEKYGAEGLDKAVKEYEKALLERGREHVIDGQQMAQIMGHPDGARGTVAGFMELAAQA